MTNDGEPELCRGSAVLLKVGGFEEEGYLGVSKNRGTPKWMVYNGKPY